MATFQIVYDDFSGGYYTGQRSTELPRNTFTGKNGGTNPYGQLMTYGAPLLAYTQSAVASTTQAAIPDQWIVGENVYCFASWYASGAWTSKMVKFNVANGPAFPSPSVTTTTLTGAVLGKVSYDNISGKFFYVRTDGGSAGYIRSITTAGTDASVSTALGGQGITDLVLYGYRNVAWGGTSRKLFYSNTDLTTFSTSQYYEFAGAILNVLPRSGDLLVVCTTGVYSMTGVLGSGVTIQQIVPEANVANGMAEAVIVDRRMVFADASSSGLVDGRIYELIGASVRPIAQVAQLDLTTVVNLPGARNMRCFNIPDGQIGAVVSDIASLYLQDSAGRWCRFEFDPLAGIDYREDQYSIARPGPDAQNEYVVFALVNDEYQIDFYRIVYNVPELYYVDTDFRANTVNTGTEIPTASLVLPEYWHKQPYQIKHIIVQWNGQYGVTGSGITFTVEPTGIVDTSDPNVVNSSSTSVSTRLTPTLNVGPWNTERIFVNNAAKGYGMNVKLTMTMSTIKRLIVVCED